MTERVEAAIRELADALLAEMRASVAPPVERLLDVDEASAMLGIGRTAVYGEIGAGRLRSVKLGRRRLVPSSAVAEFIAR